MALNKHHVITYLLCWVWEQSSLTHSTALPNMLGVSAWHFPSAYKASIFSLTISHSVSWTVSSLTCQVLDLRLPAHVTGGMPHLTLHTPATQSLGYLPGHGRKG